MWGSLLVIGTMAGQHDETLVGLRRPELRRRSGRRRSNSRAAARTKSRRARVDQAGLTVDSAAEPSRELSGYLAVKRAVKLEPSTAWLVVDLSLDLSQSQEDRNRAHLGNGGTVRWTHAPAEYPPRRRDPRRERSKGLRARQRLGARALPANRWR